MDGAKEVALDFRVQREIAGVGERVKLGGNEETGVRAAGSLRINTTLLSSVA